ncbi:MAG: hypothetical protein JSV95_04060 [Gemmatimonadota bacterium]|nr:MAG: hypothetical protein JSV95_04060 [Gemmatimonadota bacterium]
MSALAKGAVTVVLIHVGRAYARHRLRSLRRELTRPWREGGDSAAAAAGRWVGFSLAVGAKAIGVAAAVRGLSKRS